MLTKRNKVERMTIVNTLLTGIYEELLKGETDDIDGLLQIAVYAQVEMNRIVFDLNQRNGCEPIADTPQTERRTDRDGDAWEWRGDAWYCIGQADAPKTKRSIEADKVVEALKMCDHNSDGEQCKTCTYRDTEWDGAWESEDGEWCCYKQLASDAISLIERTERSE